MRHPRTLLLLLAGLLAVAGCAGQATPAVPGGPADAGGPAVTPGPPAPPDGQRWVSFGDAMVAVPQDWGYADAPGPAWCAGDPERFPTEPYVANPQLYRMIPMIACPGPLPPEEFRAASVALDPAPVATDAPPAESTDGDWLTLRRVVGAVQVGVTVPTADRTLAEGILATARTTEVDHLGCATTSPIQQGVGASPSTGADLTADADSVVVCQYALAPDGQFGAVGTPGLVASAELGTEAADALLTAARAGQAEDGSGERRPAPCDGRQGTAMVLHAGDAELYAFPSACGGAGWLDTGTVRVDLTDETCSALFAPPVTFFAGDRSCA